MALTPRLRTDDQGRRMALAVLGTSRSGTSLLASLLNEHPALRMGSEQFQVDVLLGAAPAYSGVGPDDRLVAFFAQCDLAAQGHAGAMWGNKLTTEVLLRGGGHPERGIRRAVRDLVERLPAVPIVFITRDGRTAVRSKMVRAGDSLEKACRHWSIGVEFLVALEDAQHPMVAIRYEDLVRAPTDTMTVVCDALGIPFMEQILEGTNSSFLLPEYRHGGFEPWRSDPRDLPDAAMVLIADDLKRAGYEA